DLLPLLPTDKTYDVLMIANAMGIAARELEAWARPDDETAKAIAGFYQAAGLGGTHAPTEQCLARLIRSRAIDTAHDASLHDLLLSLTRSRLAVSNPKYLRRSGTEDAHEQ